MVVLIALVHGEGPADSRVPRARWRCPDGSIALIACRKSCCESPKEAGGVMKSVDRWAANRLDGLAACGSFAGLRTTLVRVRGWITRADACRSRSTSSYTCTSSSLVGFHSPCARAACVRQPLRLSCLLQYDSKHVEQQQQQSGAQGIDRARACSRQVHRVQGTSSAVLCVVSGHPGWLV